ncbi:zinc-ribbon domain-containing protein [Pseudorhodobacter aquimaris]|uniref:zinc-ribbon domain-containing protein n=1 Tax=Pseudorhodobacter aquimaris TaxID=687412 RepID=UPI0018DBC2D5|nr:zinc-ribbon domain-containing protein [Pseudorhodobacter aquimaris]
MRLVCPNCGAQYEVDTGAIPDSGRDVQCSDCGHAWFQAPLDIDFEAEEARLTPKAAVRPAESVAPPQDPIPEPAPTPASEPFGSPPPLYDHDDEDDDEEEQDAECAPAPQPVAPRRGMDDSLLSVLREEADREAAVRRSEVPRPLEIQPDLGLEETAGAAKAVRDRLARLRVPEPVAEDTDKPTARRDLLPDIEEINSTLRASSENRHGEADGPEQSAALDTEHSKAAFRSGFLLILLVAFLLMVTYMAAPKLVEQFPAAEGVLKSYVAAVNGLRLWLDQYLGGA